MSNPLLTPQEVTDIEELDIGTTGLECGLPTLQLLDDVHHLVRDLLTQWQHPSDALERRHRPRIPFLKSIALFEVDEESELPIGNPYLVNGKDISMKGVGFSHTSPLPFTKVAIGFELPDGCSQFVLVRLSWCRFTRRGTYESGGMFLRRVAPPQGIALDWNGMHLI